MAEVYLADYQAAAQGGAQDPSAEKSPDERYQGALDLELDLKRLQHTLHPGGEIESPVRAASPAGFDSAEPPTSPSGERASRHAVSGSYTANSPGGAGT